jgi:hypothetical protein
MPRAPRLLAAALALALPAAAPAATATRSDRRGDAKAFGYNDLRSARAAVRGGLIEHTISVYGALPRDFPGPRLYVDTSSRPGPEYSVARFPDGATEVRAARSGRRAAGARWTRLNATTIRLRFSPRAIGRPARYRWRAYTESVNEQTDPEELDSLPDRGWISQRLR